MNTRTKGIALVLLAAAIAGTVALRASEESGTAAPDDSEVGAAEPLPRLVDLGSKTCVPCRMMAPILDELKAEYNDQFETVFIDVRENREAATQYGIRMIPTQIFYDAEGRERFRHEGFYGKDDILGKWKELGVL